MEYSVEQWVEDASSDRVTFRQAVHTILLAISGSDYLRPIMVMKGGMLLGIRYKSSRFTEDIDFSTTVKLSDVDSEEFIDELDDALVVASTELPYRVKCKVQSLRVQPRNGAGEATFPSFNLKIGYASEGNIGAMRRLESGQSTNTIKIDYSFNEETYQLDEVCLEGEDSINAYGLNDVVAEKYRSIIQQSYRNRNRRQDIYDLHYLLTTVSDISTEEKMNILLTLLRKSEGRLPDGAVNSLSLDDSDTIDRSRHEYHLLAEEIDGDLPDFDVIYSVVNDFYKSLPWECLK